jgi:quinol monooxygenase YgiN
VNAGVPAQPGDLVLVVEVTVRAGRMAEYLAIAAENARQSVTTEPACRRFDVAQAEDEADRVVLYEIYVGQPGYEAHRQTAHYARYKEATRDLVTQTTVRRFTLVA